MTTQLDLFGNVIEERVIAEPYHEVSKRDTTSPACGDCVHCDERLERYPVGIPRWIWVCKLTKTKVDPDDGTCGRFEKDPRA